MPENPLDGSQPQSTAVEQRAKWPKLFLVVVVIGSAIAISVYLIKKVESVSPVIPIREETIATSTTITPTFLYLKYRDGDKIVHSAIDLVRYKEQEKATSTQGSVLMDPSPIYDVAVAPDKSFLIQTAGSTLVHLS